MSGKENGVEGSQKRSHRRAYEDGVPLVTSSGLLVLFLNFEFVLER